MYVYFILSIGKYYLYSLYYTGCILNLSEQPILQWVLCLLYAHVQDPYFLHNLQVAHIQPVSQLQLLLSNAH